MDEKVAKWIIEFLLRKTIIDEKIINGVLLCLPISNNDNRLKKTILLRKIESEISNGSVSENLLELFEIIEELDHREGTRASDSMKKAYCAVAVDCTLRFLEENAKDNGSYVLAVERVWKNRVCLMEALVSEESKCWLEDIAAAIWDSEVYEKISVRNTRNEALKAVRGFLKEAWNSMGPAFLELVAAKVGDEVEALRRDVGSVNQCPKVMANQGVQKGRSLVRRKDVEVKTKHLRGAKISDAGEVAVGSINTANDVPIDDIEEVPETPQSNSLQLQADAGGYHPDTSQVARNLSFSKDNDVPAHNIDSGLAPQLNSNVRACHPDVCQATHNMSLTKDNELLPRTIEKLQAHQSSSVLRDSHPDGFRGACTQFVTMVTDNANGVKAAENRTGPVIQTPKVNRLQKALKTSVVEVRKAPTEPLQETIQVAETLCSTGVTHNHKNAVENQAGVEKHAFAEVNRVQQAFETSSVEVHAAGKNPGANASRTVENVSPKVATNNVNSDAVLANQTQPGNDAPRESTKNNPKNVDKDKILEKIEGSDTHYPRELPKRKRSLMEPNSTSHTMEWDDQNDIESRDLHAHSPSISKRSRSSALKLYESRNFAMRRLRRKWTPQEEDTLRDGVKRFGRSWKYILECYREIFGDRTYVDLKDKWRNMTRYES